MTIQQTAVILAMIAASDRRTVGDIDVEVWHDAIGDLDFQQAQDAVRAHIRDGQGWLDPSKLRQHVKRLRADRLSSVVLPVPNVDPDDPTAFAAEHRALVEAIAAGTLDPEEYAASGRTLTGAPALPIGPTAPRPVHAMLARAFPSPPTVDHRPLPVHGRPGVSVSP